jgi:hypothetical protein
MLRNLFGSMTTFPMLDADDGAKGGGGSEEKRTYSQEYVSDLRAENADHRTKAKEAKEKAELAEKRAIEAETKLKDADKVATINVLTKLGLSPDEKKGIDELINDCVAHFNGIQTRSNNRLISAELNKVCTELNIVDSEAASKLIDMSKVKINDKDEVEGIKPLLEQLIKDKPYLVGAHKGTGKVPPNSSNTTTGTLQDALAKQMFKK